MRVAVAIMLSDQSRRTLESWARGRRTPARLVLRAKIILKAASGLQNREIAEQLSTDRECVGRWRSRFAKLGLAGIEKDAPRSGRKPSIPRTVVEKIVRLTTKSRPKNATHWSTRSMAQAIGVSPKTVHRVWQAHGLKPHLSRTFKLSNDPQFLEKLTDVVGLYLDPPEHALVLCADEKSQIQALDRTQPGLPIKKGRCGTMTHDYKRNGTTTLFAAIELASGEVIGECMPKHRHQEWINFLKSIDERTPQQLALHLIVDNYATHKHPKVKAWLKRHPRFHIHFIPTSASWLNLIERFFRDLTDRRIRRGVFHNVPSLIEAITDYLRHHNHNPKSFKWTATVEQIMEKVSRARARLEKTASE
ncbi:MAG: IS630 family transposase [Acidimicrobiia bacterium]